MKKNIIFILMIFAMVSCQSEIENSTTNINDLPDIKNESYTPLMVHPGILQTNTTIQFMKDVVTTADVNSPKYKTYLALKADPRAQSNYALKGPFAFIAREGTNAYTKAAFDSDFAAAYFNALMFTITDNQAHAAKSLEILLAYANTLQGVTGNDQPLLAGFNGFQIAYALEILRYKYTVSDEDFNKINTMLRKYFLPILEEFFVTTPYSNGNWGLTVIRTYMAFAILWNDVNMYKKGVDIFLHRTDNGTLLGYVDITTGQCQESGREQLHAQLGIGQLGSICELAYQQGNDLYSLYGNAVMKAFEYSAKYNLGYNDVPFKNWKDASGKYSNWTVIGSQYRGEFRSIYGMAYNHYVGRKKLSMPYTKEVLKDEFPLGIYNGDGICYDVFQFCDSNYSLN
jgi:hypothetical protein